MPKITFRTVPVVLVAVRGEKVAKSLQDEYPGATFGPNDGGLVERLITFMGDHRIYPHVVGGSSGGGEYHGFFTAENAEKIEVWLREQDAKKGSWRV